jgi:methionine sulfoxide reductase catalytic subunit
MRIDSQLTGLDIAPSEITAEASYRRFQNLNRRGFLQATGLFTAGTGVAANTSNVSPVNISVTIKNLVKNPNFISGDELTTWNDAISYDNYYEFGTNKEDPVEQAKRFAPFPWTVEIAGECEVKGKFSFADLIKGFPLEERIYRHRCVEAWAMVLPWVGVPLASVLQRFKPNSNAKYVAFTALNDPSRMPGQNYATLDWPYREGLRIDEAMHPLSLMATGLYGRVMPNQNGAPLRLITPWKYGFKGIKGIVKIEFLQRQPFTSWNDTNPDEYGFYANVNPKVDHPRWSQASERKLTGSGFSLFRTKRVETLLFNGYARQVAGLYAGMDLRVNF